MNEYVVIFALGSDMDHYYCRILAPTLEAAKAKALAAYPDRWIYVAPLDEKFSEHLSAYKKEPIPLGSKTILQIIPPADEGAPLPLPEEPKDPEDPDDPDDPPVD